MPRKPTSAPAALAAAVPPNTGDEILYVTILGGLPADGEAAPPAAAPPSGPPPPAPPVADRRDRVHFYGLIDPRDGLFHYAGYTRQRLEARRRQHLADARSGRHGPRGDWLRDLLESGGEPEIQLLEELIDPVPHTVHIREQAWIAGLQAQGHPLTNVDVAPEPPAVVPFAPAPARSPAPRAVRWGPLLAGALLTAALLAVVAVGGLPRPRAVPITLDWGRLAGALPAPPSPPRPAGSDAPGPAGNRPASTLTGVPDRTARTPPAGAPSSPVAGGPASAATLGAAAPLPATSPPAATPSAAPRRVGSTSIQVRLGQSFAAVAAQLGLTPDQLAAHLGGRRQVYAGEEIVVPLYADPPLAGAPATGVPAGLPARPLGGGPPPISTSTSPPVAHPTYDDPAIASGASLGDQEVGAVVPRYDDPAIRSGASIGGASADPADAPPPTPPAAGAPLSPASPTYDDPAITSGGSIGGVGP